MSTENNNTKVKKDNSGSAAKGAIWVISAQGIGQIIRLAGNMILTRLLFEEAFGIMALVNVVYQGLQLFSDVGIGPSIIQNKRGDNPDFLNTAWTIQVIRGLTLWFCGCLLALPLSMFYDEPQLAWILPISTFTACIQGFNSTSLFTLNRHLHMGRLIGLELTKQVVALVTMATWAFIDRSVWALVSGGIASSATIMILSHTLVGDIRNRFCWNKKDADSLFRFGRWIFISTVLTFCATRTDRLIFGKLVSIEQLGVYSIALMIAMMPFEVLVQLSLKVVFPVYSKKHNSGEELRTIFRRVRFPMLIVGGWMLSGFIAGGPTIINILYDQRYHAAGTIVQILSIGSWFMVLGDSNMAALLAKGQAKWLAATYVGKLIGMIICIPLGYHLGGFHGAIIGLSISTILQFAVSALGASLQELHGWLQNLGTTIMVAISGFSGFFCALGLAQLHVPDILVAMAVFFCVTLAWSPILFFYLRSRLGGSFFPKF